MKERFRSWRCIVLLVEQFHVDTRTGSGQRSYRAFEDLSEGLHELQQVRARLS